MKRGKRLKRGLKNPENSLYINANLIHSEALNQIRKPQWKRKIKTGQTLSKLKEEGFNLVTSILTRAEVVRKLILEENLAQKKARSVYWSVLEKHGIMEISGIHKHITLNDALIDKFALTNISFRDNLHLLLAKKHNIPVCTHDKKFKENISKHKEKIRIYDQVYKPEELIKIKKK